MGGSRDALYEALHDYIAAPKDPKSAVIFTHLQPVGLFNAYMLFFSYDGPNPPPGAFGKFWDIKATIDMCKTRTYTDLVSSTLSAALQHVDGFLA